MKGTTKQEEFQSRHIGPRESELRLMLDAVGARSLDELIDQTIPQNIRLKKALNLSEGMSEQEFLRSMRRIADKNEVFKSYIGLGYYDCIVPSVIQRNILENPGWYTQYTPYQAEVAQGRLEALLNFQTMVCDLTKMDVANASLLDEATAAAEAMAMLHGLANRNTNEHPVRKFFVAESCFPQTIDVLRTRAWPPDIEIVLGDHAQMTFDRTFFGALVQFPAEDGVVFDYRAFVDQAHAHGVLVVVAADLLSLALLTPPGEWGADVVVGSSQRFGIPLGNGGPHAAYFATKNEFIRQMPGRIIGVSVDAENNTAYRMTLQTREQHIRREKATSNICTAQALLAIMAGMYAVYHGPTGIRRIASNVHTLTVVLDRALRNLGFHQLNPTYFDTLKIHAQGKIKTIQALAEAASVNFRYIDEENIGISIDETTTAEDIEAVVEIFAKSVGKRAEVSHDKPQSPLPQELGRTSSYLTHPVFQRYHSETELVRYMKSLENKDLSLTHSMIPLGSCTMKLNATSELMPISYPGFSKIHPFAPPRQTPGYQHIFGELEQMLCEITGLAACSLQPNSGAQGEFAGLMVIRAFHRDRGEGQRNVALIPQSAHGTNPASAVMAGMKVVVIKCDERGNVMLEDLREKAREHRNDLAVLMITYPSTHGVFEAHVQEICSVVHKYGGQVYMDGANLNAQVGLTSVATIGADVCHINLHKTFSIPHGGGGPGMGPICVAKHLAAYLPSHPLVRTGGEKGIHAVSAAPWGSASIVLVSYGYLMMLGSKGVTEASKYAILNANYLKARLEQHFSILYQGEHARVAHEFILDPREFKQKANVDAEDISKRLMDYGFHAPTVSFPVAGTLMIEPTESESKAEIDRFAEALISIRQEIQEILDGKADPQNNVLKNAPHTAQHALKEPWDHPYSRFKAVYPLDYLRQNKFWPATRRVNSSYGDRNIVCVCPPVEEYLDEPVRS